MDENIYCNFCQQNPHQFTILLCDHVICSRCLQNNLKKYDDISMIKCKCGLRTYCNQNSMRFSTSSTLVKKDQSSIINSNISAPNLRYGFPQFDKNAIKKDKCCQKSLNSKKKVVKLEQNSNFLKTQPLQFQQQTTVFSSSNIEKINKFSNTQSQQMSNSKQNNSKYINSMISSTNSEQEFSKNLTKQLKFLNIQYEKTMQECKQNFYKVIKSIQKSYQKVINGIKKFCLEQIVQASTNVIINLPQIIQDKYDHTIGKKIMELNQFLLNSLQNYTKKGIRHSRPTVFLQRQIPYKQNKSKAKVEQDRQIFLTVSPKWKSPNKQVFIKFIEKQKVKNKGKGSNLIKRTIKGDKIRIF